MIVYVPDAPQLRGVLSQSDAVKVAGAKLRRFGLAVVTMKKLQKRVGSLMHDQGCSASWVAERWAERLSTTTGLSVTPDPRRVQALLDGRGQELTMKELDALADALGVAAWTLYSPSRQVSELTQAEVRFPDGTAVENFNVVCRDARAARSLAAFKLIFEGKVGWLEVSRILSATAVTSKCQGAGCMLELHG